jgi:hypothetical protein
LLIVISKHYDTSSVFCTSNKAAGAGGTSTALLQRVACREELFTYHAPPPQPPPRLTTTSTMATATMVTTMDDDATAAAKTPYVTVTEPAGVDADVRAALHSLSVIDFNPLQFSVGRATARMINTY